MSLAIWAQTIGFACEQAVFVQPAVSRAGGVTQLACIVLGRSTPDLGSSDKKK